MIVNFIDFLNEEYNQIKITLSGDDTKTINFSKDDVVLGGRFKNKRITVKNIDINDKGDIVINGKPFMKFREFNEKEKD